MATYNPTVVTTSAGNVLSHLAPNTTAAQLQLGQFLAAGPHFVTAAPTTSVAAQQAAAAAHLHQQTTNTTSSSYTFVQIKREPCQVSEVTTSNTCSTSQQQQQQQQQHHQQHHQHHNGTSARTTTTATASQHHHHQQHHHGLLAASSSTKTLAAATSSATSTLTTLVKIEAAAPNKVHDMDRLGHHTLASSSTAPGGSASTGSVPIGIAVARKRPQETTNNNTLLGGGGTALPLQQPLGKDLNCFGIRVADLGGVGTGCNNIFFTGGGDLMSGAAAATTAEELALQSVNRAPSTFWQYPSNALPIESVISMSPAATVGLQYSREASRGQVVLLPAATALDPFQQAAAAAAAAAAFVWPAYIPQQQPTATTAAAAAAAAAAALQPSSNFIFPSMTPHSALQTQPYATSLQLFGSNYLTVPLCQHNQQTQQSSTSSINLSLGAMPTATTATLGATSSTSCSSVSRSFLSVSTAATTGMMTAGGVDHLQKPPKIATLPASLAALQAPPMPLALPMPPAHAPLLLPPSAMKIEDWSGTADFMAAAINNANGKSVGQASLTAIAGAAPTAAINYEMRGDKISAGPPPPHTNLLDLNGNTQALNLMRLPTPPTSATMETAAATMAQSPLQTLFQVTSAPTPALLNLTTSMPRASNCATSAAGTAMVLPGSALNNNNNNHHNHFLNGAAATLSDAIGPPTPLGDDVALNFKTHAVAAESSAGTAATPLGVVGVPRAPGSNVGGAQLPQMQDVNIQTDTPVCSEDENSSCPLGLMQQSDGDGQQPLELTKPAGGGGGMHAKARSSSSERRPATAASAAETMLVQATKTECHNDDSSEAPPQHQQLEQEQPMPLQHVADSSAGSPSAAIMMTTATASDEHERISPEEHLNGLELLSKISTCTLAKSTAPIHMPSASRLAAVRVKQEPLDEHFDALTNETGTQPLQSAMEASMFGTAPPAGAHCLLPSLGGGEASLLLPAPPPEPLGGLSLLCALAEQRIQEEEAQSGGNNGLFGSPHAIEAKHTPSPPAAPSPHVLPPPPPPTASPFLFQRQSPFCPEPASSFPSMDGIELPQPSTSGLGGGLGGGGLQTTALINGAIQQCAGIGVAGDASLKRKKHKHSKSSKASSSGSTSGKRSQRCGKKNKKSKTPQEKERRRQQKLLTQQAAGSGGVSGVGANDDEEELQEELKSAISCVEPSYAQRFGKWPDPQEIFDMMETNMRMRLADITRQYRKKKRKLDEMAKSKKKRKQCSKLAAAALAASAQQQLQQQQQPVTLACGPSLVLSTVGGLGSSNSPLCDYKFANFGTSAGLGGCNGADRPPYLNSSPFRRFGDKTPQPAPALVPFPPPPEEDAGASPAACSSTSATAVYKPVRLEPSALDGADNSRGSALRLAQKHASSERAGTLTIVCKERRLMSGQRRSTDGSGGDENVSVSSSSSPPKQQQQQQQQLARVPGPRDGELTLSSEHLYRKETRVLTDMGGLFYAGVMKPLQPPDVYAITLDGERGNKPHIMSREEILKDTIIEVAPRSVDCVPVGTRLCAYWSQQYRCLYPGRAIESESSDDEAATQDFVSVEFDDGDSGRIRLQNIRLLLSNYPIAEYNDNPLYSIGKQKKCAAAPAGGSTAAVRAFEAQYECASLASMQQQQQQQEQAEEHFGHLGRMADVGRSGDGPGMRLDASEEYPPREMYAKRTERKRMKSLKKRTQEATARANGTAAGASILLGATSSIAAPAMTATTTTTTAMAAGSDNDGAARKHHKHKKRKKHKKHHRKLVELAAAQSFAASVAVTSTPSTGASSFNGKREVDEEVTPPPAVVSKSENVRANVKLEAALVTPPAVVKVKAERPNEEDEAAREEDQVAEDEEEEEEETTSNLMSDENKCDGDDSHTEHNNSKGSKIAAFLPDRQLWGWLGIAYRKAGVKGRARKQFYKTIKRGKETITVGDCAVFLSTGRPDRPYIGRIESMWETTAGNKVVRVRWFYHPEETNGCPELKYPGGLFESPHEDENDVQTISHRCEVLPFERYFGKFGADAKQYQSIYDNNDTYYLAGYYNPRAQTLKMQDDIPALGGALPAASTPAQPAHHQELSQDGQGQGKGKGSNNSNGSNSSSSMNGSSNNTTNKQTTNTSADI